MEIKGKRHRQAFNGCSLCYFLKSAWKTFSAELTVPLRSSFFCQNELLSVSTRVQELKGHIQLAVTAWISVTSFNRFKLYATFELIFRAFLPLFSWKPYFLLTLLVYFSTTASLFLCSMYKVYCLAHNLIFEHPSKICFHASDIRFRGGVSDGASVLRFSNHKFLCVYELATS